MGAFGMNTCRYCDREFHDLDTHKCRRSELKTKISVMSANLEAYYKRLEAFENFVREFDYFRTAPILDFRSNPNFSLNELDIFTHTITRLDIYRSKIGELS